MAIGHRVKQALAEKASEAEILAASAADLEAQEKSPEEVEAEEQAREAAQAQAGGTVNLTFEQLMALVTRASSGGMTPESVAQIAAQAAQSVAAVTNPKKPELSIGQIPRASAYNPVGERDRPRPKLKCHMYYGSAPLGSPKEVTTLTYDECVALNQLVPGHYRIEKTDGSHAIIELKGQMNANRELDRLWILLPPGDENKNAYPKTLELARQCCEANRVQPVVAA